MGSSEEVVVVKSLFLTTMAWLSIIFITNHGYKVSYVPVVLFFVVYGMTRSFAITDIQTPTPSVFVNCTTEIDAFKCLLNGNCIPKALHCDAKADCADGSDETFCTSRCQGADWFLCNNGHCISKIWLCDKEDDCMDWSDEANCHEEEEAADLESDITTCPGTDYRCGDGVCIPVSWVCDQQDDCHAGDDENPELCGKKEECDKFTCSTGASIPHKSVLAFVVLLLF